MKVLAMAGDPGGARALAAVISELLGRGCGLCLGGYRHAPEIFREHGWQALDCGAREGWSPGGWISSERPDVCFTATSVNGMDLEKDLIRAARAAGVPTVALLDFWSNYRRRFASGPPDGPMDSLPDRIAVMDATAVGEMMREGFGRELLAITGQPAFDELFLPRDRAAIREEIRAAFGLTDCDRKLVIFASQPLWEMGGTPYHELDVLRLVVREFEDHDRPPALWIRPHPREEEAKFAEFLRPGVFVSNRFDRIEAALGADAVTGMSSAFLLEAALMGVPALGLQPGQEDGGPLPLERLGLGDVALTEEDCRAALGTLIRGGVGRRGAENVGFGPGSAARVADLVMECAGSSGRLSE